MYIIGDGVISYMSAVIGVCGTNFCTLCSVGGEIQEVSVF